MREFLKTAVDYLKRHIVLLIMCMLTVLIFALIFSLYDLPMEAVIYAVVLTAVVGSIVGVIRFCLFYGRHRTLCDVKRQIAEDDVHLPEAGSLLERDYREVVDALMQSRREIISQSDRADTERMDYYTMWAHQIKTPIAAMHLLLQTQESESNTELSEQLFKIEQYVDMVLQYLRTEDMSSDLVIAAYPLYDIVKKSVQKYAKSFFCKKITLSLSPFACDVLTDEKWLGFVIEQLLSNALKYTHSGGKISIYMDENAKKTLVIDDTGIGIRFEDLPRVFEKGFTGYNGRADKKSTGIGLYLCQKIMKKLTHSIAITSEVGVGTQVKLDLSRAERVIE